MYLDPKSTAQFRGKTPAHRAPGISKRDLLFLLLPGANLLDVTAAIEPLRVFNRLNGKPAYSWSVISEDGAAVTCSNGLSFPVDSKLPGTQASSHVVVCAGDSGYMGASDKTLQWLRRHARFGGHVAAIGTGAFTLARAGLAKDVPVTLHWSLIPVFEETFPDMECVNTRTVIGDRVSFSAGGSASLELTLVVIQDDFGNAMAQRVAECCLHEFDGSSQRAQRHPVFKAVGNRHPAILSIVRRMEASVQNPLSLAEIIREEEVSQRQVERLFKQYLGTTPLQYYRNLRLDRARSLLMETDMPVFDVALACGFSGAANFAKLYRRRFGERPSADRAAKA